MSSERGSQAYYDVVIIGAGIAGINAAYRIQTECPDLTYTILERRDNIGGAWSFFKYPGVRSDSDLYTYSFAWEPWQTNNPIATAGSIVTYVRNAATKHGIDSHVRFGSEVKEMDWGSDEQQWRLNVDAGREGKEELISARFVIAATGYFDYHRPLTARIPDIENFSGQVIHPQFWPEDLDYDGKRMVIIGSGATTITLLPAVADRVSKVTMIQRNPSYIHSTVTYSWQDTVIHRWLPATWAATLLRWKYMFMAWAFYVFSRTWPDKAREVFNDETRKILPKHVAFDPHFKPIYNVWDQRLCVCQNADLFKALGSRKADVKTGSIAAIRGKEIILESGESIEADILVTATGLRLQILGGAKVTIDGGDPIDIGQRFMWRGALVQDIPNALIIIGYFNYSWTTGIDFATKIFIFLMKQVAAKGATSFRSVIAPEKEKDMTVKPLWNLTSTYLKTGNQTFPKASNVAPWLTKDNYPRDWLAWKLGGSLEDLKFDTRSDQGSGKKYQ